MSFPEDCGIFRTNKISRQYIMGIQIPRSPFAVLDDPQAYFSVEVRSYRGKHSVVIGFLRLEMATDDGISHCAMELAGKYENIVGVALHGMSMSFRNHLYDGEALWLPVEMDRYKGFKDCLRVAVAYGDDPLIGAKTMQALIYKEGLEHKFLSHVPVN